jgi:hypothetical protein
MLFTKFTPHPEHKTSELWIRTAEILSVEGHYGGSEIRVAGFFCYAAETPEQVLAVISPGEAGND